jgi:probable F420-dependent oxidoreductase
MAADIRFGFIPTEGGHFYQEALQEVVYGEELGFDSVWLEEHHGVRDHYWPSPITCLAGFATRTSQILLGTDIIVLPFYHPVRVAEDAAMVDVMSNGRFILGVAIGYRPKEFELYQKPLKRRGARFVEQLKVIKALWTRDEVQFEGEFYHLQDATIEPKPITQPHPPIWIGGWGDLSLKRAARLGDAWIPGPTAGLNKLLTCQEKYQTALHELGKPEPAVRPLTRELVIADSDEEAFELAEKYLLINYRDEYGGGWDHPLIGAEDTAPIDKLEALGKDRFIIGGPERCIQIIRNFIDQFNTNHLIFRLYFPGMPHEHILHELELISREVIPAFR